VTVALETVAAAAADRTAVVAFVTEAMVVPRPERAVPAPGTEIYFVRSAKANPALVQVSVTEPEVIEQPGTVRPSPFAPRSFTLVTDCPNVRELKIRDRIVVLIIWQFSLIKTTVVQRRKYAFYNYVIINTNSELAEILRGAESLTRFLHLYLFVNPRFRRWVATAP
jgi:hypothetical protein